MDVDVAVDVGIDADVGMGRAVGVAVCDVDAAVDADVADAAVAVYDGKLDCTCSRSFTISMGTHMMHEKPSDHMTHTYIHTYMHTCIRTYIHT